MQKLSSLTNVLLLGVNSEAATQMRSAVIDPNTGVIQLTGANWTTGGNDLAIGDGVSIVPTGQLKGSKVWNSVWNDIVDFQVVCDEVVYGKCYFDTFDGAKICTLRNQKSVIGIASDTFGFAVGNDQSKKQVPIAIGGWALAFVDRVYEPGTVLTNDENGNLTEMSREEKLEYPERIVGLYKKPELDKYFGDGKTRITVNGRHWVKVK